jgi:hypothetical protein
MMRGGAERQETAKLQAHYVTVARNRIMVIRGIRVFRYSRVVKDIRGVACQKTKGSERKRWEYITPVFFFFFLQVRNLH